jgi:hypothetical protein
MLSTTVSRFNWLILAVIISVNSLIGAFVFANAAQSSSIQPEAARMVTGDAPSGQARIDMSNQQLVGETWRRTELYFGTSKPDGSVVTIEEFEDFVDEIVTPRFPDGLTLLAGDGQWRDSTGTLIEEESNMLILLYPLDDRDANGEIEQIREAYKEFFQQESVLRVDDYSWVSF